jgi:DNA helicase-2/ATP-dependent DNA helicase PcrA
MGDRVAIETVLTRLSPEQQAVVQHRGGPQLVVAGPGSGKSGSLIARVAWLVHEGMPPGKILVSTFTNRATNEFRSRLRRLLGEQAGRVWLGTLHGTGARLLRAHGPAIGIAPTFSIYGPREGYRLIRQAMKENEIPVELLPVDAAYDAILRHKENLRDPAAAEHLAERENDLLEAEIAGVYRRYQRLLKEHGALDFGDLVGEAVRLLQVQPSLVEQLGFAEVIVDEAHDTDPAQFEMVCQLLGQEQPLTLAYDSDQLLYSWRSASPQLVLGFRDRFPRARERRLGKNYRCTGHIVQAAAALIQNNRQRIDHRLWTENPVGPPLTQLFALDEIEEAVKVVEEAERVKAALSLAYREIAFLYRTNSQSQLLEEQCLCRHVPYQVTGKRFFDRVEIRDLLLWLKVIDCPDDPFALEELLNRPKRRVSQDSMKHLYGERRKRGMSLWALLQVGPPLEGKELDSAGKLLQQIRTYQEITEVSLPELVERLQWETGLRSFHQGRDTAGKEATGRTAAGNLDRLQALVTDHFPGAADKMLPAFLEYAALMTGEEEPEDAVQLMTLHAAKGLEFQVVFLTGCEEKLLPNWRAVEAGDHSAEMEEERRLAYVGMTRARQLLYLTHAGARSISGGRAVRSRPSRFLREVPPQLTTRRK